MKGHGVKKVHSYADIPSMHTFREIFASRKFYTAPLKWYVVMTDVVNSTHAINTGRYKEVNTAGSIAAMALANIRKDMDFPFIFGGDGMTFLLPPEIVDEARDILIDTTTMVQDVFGLDLRAGIIPVNDIYEDGHLIRVGKLEISNRYTQAIIKGSGVDHAEKLLKDPAPDNPYRLRGDRSGKKQADYSGFTCRWADIPSSRGETFSLIVKPRELDDKKGSSLLADILEGIYGIIGTEEKFIPITEKTQFVSKKNLYQETGVISGKRKGFSHFIHGLIFNIQMFFLPLVVKFKIPFRQKWKNLANAPKDNVINADFRKFDGTIKLVASSSSADRKKLEEYLHSFYKRELIFYGMHVSNRALMTCLMLMSDEKEVHFIDAADGGYAYAAHNLKQQIKNASKQPAGKPL